MLGLHTGQRTSLRLRESQQVPSSQNMSYALPQNGPTQRIHHGTANGNTQENVNGGLGEKISNVFGGERKASLPMYKDKPFQYPSSSRVAPWYKRRRFLAGLLLLVVLGAWWSGVFSSRKPGRKTSTSIVTDKTSTENTNVLPDIEETGSSWFSGKIDWEARAQNVKEIFRISWNGYEQNGWGE